MKDAIGFQRIIERARLDPNTAQYVLRDPEILSGMPSSGGRRKFNLRQAVQLAVCTYLVKVNVPLARAAKITLWCEQKATKYAKAKAGRRKGLYVAEATDPWTLRVVDHRRVRLWRDKLIKDSDLFDPDEYHDIEGEEVDGPAIGLMLVEINLSELELRIEAAFQSA
jgi:hypothetical protein